MAPDPQTLATEKTVHRGHRDALAALFQARPFQIVSWEELFALVGANYMQRISEARRELHLPIECVPRYGVIDGRRKRITGDYRLRPDALGRDAADLTKAVAQDLFTDLAGWQQ